MNYPPNVVQPMVVVFGTSQVRGLIVVERSPSSINNAVITTGNPITITQNNTSVNNLTIEASASLADNNNRSLTVGGDLIVDGTISGTLALTLSGLNKIIGGNGNIASSSAVTITGGNKTIASGSNLYVSGSMAINGPFTITNNGNITIEGNITGTSNSRCLDQCRKFYVEYWWNNFISSGFPYI